MSQEGLVDIIGTHPEIPTEFIANVGTAVPIANQLELLGSVVAAAGIPFRSIASGNTVTYQVQYASAIAATDATDVGLAAFNSSDFTVDANGFVTLSATAGGTSFTVDASTPPGTNPVAPSAMGLVTVTGGQVAAGSTANVIRTNSLAVNTYTIEIQRSSAQVATTIGANGVSHFDNTDFTVDANGFVSLSGAVGQTLTGDTGGALAPTAGNWNILSQPTAGASVTFDGLVSTLSFNVTDANSNTYIGSLVGYNNTLAVANTGLGYGAFEQVTSGSNNVAIGYGSLNRLLGGDTNTAVGVNSLNQITSPNNNVAIGYAAGTNITTGGNNILIGVSAGNGFASTEHSNIVIGQSLGTVADANTIRIGVQGAGGGQQNRCFLAGIVGITVSNEQFVTIDSTTGQLGIRTSSGVGETITGDSGGALNPTAGNWNLLGSGSITTVGSGSTLTTQLTGLTNHNVLIGAGTSTITNVAPSATSGVALISQGAASDPAFGTVVVAGGGTGATTLTGVLTGNGTSAVTANAITQYAVVIGGASNAVASTSVGSAGQVLQSSGAGVNPAYSTATYPSTTGANTMLISTSANVVTTTTFVEAGAYTPVLAFGGASVGITYGTQLGRYIRVGNMITLTVDITLTNKGSSVGNATISLPSAAAAGVPTVEMLAFLLTVTTTGTYTTLDLPASASTGTLVQVIATTGAAAALTNTAFGNTSVIRISGSYFVG